MKLRKDWVVIALIFMTMVFLRGNAEAYDMAEYVCPLNQGNEWTYQYTINVEGGPNDGLNESYSLKKVINGTELVNGVETIKMEYVINEAVDSYYCVVMDSEGFKMHKQYISEIGMYYIYDPPLTIFPATFNVGEVYEESISMSVYSADNDKLMDTATGSETVSLELVENVTVPAGTFKDCLKISSLASYPESTSGITVEFDEIAWYARNIGVVKQEVTLDMHNPFIGDSKETMTYELTDYDVEQPTPCPATVALGGDARGNDLNALRKFRDKVLSRNPEGQEMIRLYYQLGPVLVKAMKEDEEFKEEVKEMIEVILPMTRGAVE